MSNGRALHNSERCLNAVLNNASVAIFTMDERQHCVYMNSAAERLTGFTLAETLGRPLHDVIHHTRPDGSHYPLAECPIDRAFPENNREQGEEVFVHKNGSFYPVAFTASAIRDEDAKTVGTIIEVRDISAEKAAEAALRESEKLARTQLAEIEAIYGSVQVGLCVLDRNLRYLRINDRLAEMNGVPAADHIGRHVREVVPALADQVEAIVDRVLATGEAVNDVEFSGTTSAQPGVERCWSEHWAPLNDEDGKIIGINVAVAEVTEKRRAEAALREGRERLALALRAGRLGVHDFDPRTGAITWDDRVRELWGVSPDENVTYETFIRGVHPDDSINVEQAVTGALDSASGPHYEAEFRVISAADPSIRWIKAHGIVSFEDGQPVRLVGTVHDISDRKHDEHRMRLMIGELAHRSKNLLAIVQAMVRQTARYADGFEAFTAQLERRVAALASAHDLLFEQDGRGAKLSDLVAAQLRPFVTLPDQRVKIGGPSLMIEPQATQYLALALHELATNSTKYGALSHPGGTLGIEWKIGPEAKGCNNFWFRWSESGRAVKRPPERKGFGTFVLEQVVPSALNARVQRDHLPSGLAWTVTSDKASFCREIIA